MKWENHWAKRIASLSFQIVLGSSCVLFLFFKVIFVVIKVIRALCKKFNRYQSAYGKECFVSSLFLKLGSGCVTISLYNWCMLQIILFRYSVFNFLKK